MPEVINLQSDYDFSPCVKLLECVPDPSYQLLPGALTSPYTTLYIFMVLCLHRLTLGTFTKLQKANIGFIISVHLSHWTDFHENEYEDFLKIC
jgi:hypothetical protein